MNAIVNVEILMLIHKTICQYAPNIQYRFTYPYTQGAYYELYRNDEYELKRDKRQRKHFGHDIKIQLENKHKRLKCKCSKKHCKIKQEKTNEGSGCQCPCDNIQNYYQYNNKDCNGYQIHTSTPNAPYNSFYPFGIITAPRIMFKPLKLEHVFNLFSFTTTAKSVTTTSLQPEGEKIIHEGNKNVDNYIKDDDDKTYEDNEQEFLSIEMTPMIETDYEVTQSTDPFIATKKPLHFKENCKKRLSPQRECDKSIGKYYVYDIIERPTLGNRQNSPISDANDIYVSQNS